MKQKTSILKIYIPSEQVAANPRPFTSAGATFALEHAALTAAQTASHISVEDCCLEQKDESTLQKHAYPTEQELSRNS